MTTADGFRSLLEDVLAETGRSLTDTPAAIAAYAAERSAHLATLVGVEGFEVAVRAERDAVALRAGVAVTTEADAFDQRIAGAIHGALAFAARAALA